MRTVDGARLEGGGQLVRTAVALAALGAEPVTIEHVRAGREAPGLHPQHVAAVRAVAGCCGAEVEGLERGSDRLVFSPGPLRRADQRVEIGTAGGIALVLQAWLPVALEAGGAVTVVGGTEVPLGPTIDFADRVLLPFLRAHGGEIRLDLRQRGYVPRGGGEVRVEVEPGRLRPIDAGRAEIGSGAVSAAANLPRHVVERQLAAARGALEPAIGPLGTAEMDLRSGPSTGSSVTCWDGLRAGSALGRRGHPAEAVGREAADALLAELRLPGEVDRHLADQLLVYLARHGGAFTATACTRHAVTLLWLLEEFGYAIEHGPSPSGGEQFAA